MLNPVKPVAPLKPFQSLQTKQMLTPYAPMQPIQPVTSNVYVSYSEQQRRKRLKAIQESRYGIHSLTDVLFNEEGKNQLVAMGQGINMDYLSKSVYAGTQMMKKKFIEPAARGDAGSFITNGINMFSEDMDVLSNLTKSMVIESGSVDSSLIVGAVTGLAAGAATLLSGGTLAPVFFATSIAAGMGMVGNALARDTEGALRGLEKASGSSALGKTNYNFDIKNGFVNLAAEIAIDPLNWLSYGNSLVNSMSKTWGITVGETTLGAISLLGSVDDLVTKVAIRTNPLGWIWMGAKTGYDFATSPNMRMLGTTVADITNVLEKTPMSQMTAAITKQYKKVMGQKNAVLGRWAKTGELDALTSVDESKVFDWFSRSRDALVNLGYSLDSAYGVLKEMAHKNMLMEFAPIGGVDMTDAVRDGLRAIMKDFDTTGVAKGVYYGATDPKQLKALDQWLQAMAEQTMAVDIVRDVMNQKIEPILDAANLELRKLSLGTVVSRGQKLDEFYKQLVLSDVKYSKLEFLLKDDIGNRALDRALRVRGFSLEELYQRLKNPVNDAVEVEMLLHDLPDYSSAIVPDGKLMQDAEKVRKYAQKSLEAAQEEMSLSGSIGYYGKVLDGRIDGDFSVDGGDRADYYVKRMFNDEVNKANGVMQNKGTNIYYKQMIDWKEKLLQNNENLFGPLREIRRQLQVDPEGFGKNFFMGLPKKSDQKYFKTVIKAYDDLYNAIENYDSMWNDVLMYIENPKGPRPPDPGHVIAKSEGILKSLSVERWTYLMNKLSGTVSEDFMRSVFETIPKFGLKDDAYDMVRSAKNAMVLQINRARQIELIISEVTKGVVAGKSGIEMLQELLDTKSADGMGRLLEAISGFDLSASAEFAALGRAARNIKSQGEGFTNIMRYIKRMTDVLQAQNLGEPMKPIYYNMLLPVDVLADDGKFVTTMFTESNEVLDLRVSMRQIKQEMAELSRDGGSTAQKYAKELELKDVTDRLNVLLEPQYLALREAKQTVVDMHGRLLADYIDVKPLEEAYNQIFKQDGIKEIMDEADAVIRKPIIDQGNELVARLDDVNTQLDELYALQGTTDVDIHPTVVEEYNRAALLAPPVNDAVLNDVDSAYNKAFRDNFAFEDNTSIRATREQFSFQKGRGARVSGLDETKRMLDWPDNKSFSFVKSLDYMLPKGLQVPTPVLVELNKLVKQNTVKDYNIADAFKIALNADPVYAAKYKQLQAVMPKRVHGIKDILLEDKKGYIVNRMRNAGLTEAFLNKYYGTRVALLKALGVNMDLYKDYLSLGPNKAFIINLKSGKPFTLITDKGVLRIPGEMLTDIRARFGKIIDADAPVKVVKGEVSEPVAETIAKATKAMKDTLHELYERGSINTDMLKGDRAGNFAGKLFFENDDPWSLFRANTFGIDDYGSGLNVIGDTLTDIRRIELLKNTSKRTRADMDAILKWSASEELGKDLKPVTAMQQRRYQRQAMQQWVTRNPRILTSVLAYDEKALISQFGLGNYTMHIKPLRESLSLFFPERMLTTGDIRNVRYDTLNWDVQEIRDYIRFNKHTVKVDEKDMYQLFVDVVQHYAPLKGVKMTVDAAFKKNSIEQKVLNMMAEMSMFATRNKTWDPDLITIVGRDGTVYEGVKHITYSIEQAEKWARKNARADATATVNDELLRAREAFKKGARPGRADWEEQSKETIAAIAKNKKQVAAATKKLTLAETYVKRLTKDSTKLGTLTSADKTELTKARGEVARLKGLVATLIAKQPAEVVKGKSAKNVSLVPAKESVIFNDKVMRPYTIDIPERIVKGQLQSRTVTYYDGSFETLYLPVKQAAGQVTVKEHLSNTVQATGPRQFSADYWAGIQRAQVQKPKPYMKWSEWNPPTQKVLLPKQYEDIASRVDLSTAKTDQDIFNKFKDFTERHKLGKATKDSALSAQINAKIKELSDIQAEKIRNAHFLENHIYNSEALKNKALENWYYELTGEKLGFWEIKKLAENPNALTGTEAALAKLQVEGYRDGNTVKLSHKLATTRPEGYNLAPAKEMFIKDEALQRRVYDYVFDLIIRNDGTPLKEANIIMHDYMNISDQILATFPELQELGGKSLTNELQRVVYMFLDDQLKYAHLNTRLVNVVDASFLQDMNMFIRDLPAFIKQMNDPAFQQDALMDRFTEFKAMYTPDKYSSEIVEDELGRGRNRKKASAIGTFGAALDKVHRMNVTAASEYMFVANPELYNQTAHAFGVVHIENNVHTKAIVDRQLRTLKVFQDSEAEIKKGLAIKEAKLGQPASLARSSAQLMRELTLTIGTNTDYALKSYQEVIEARWALVSGNFAAVGRQDIADIITNAQVNSSDVFRNIEEMRRTAVRYPAELGYFLKKEGLDVTAKREIAYIEQRLTAEEVARMIYFHKPSHFWAVYNKDMTDGLNVEVLAELRNKYGMVIGGDSEFTFYRFIAGQENDALKALKPLDYKFPQSVSDLPEVMMKQGNAFDDKMQKASEVFNPFHWTDSLRVRYKGETMAAFYKARGFITEAESNQFIFDMQNQLNLWNNFTGGSEGLKIIFGEQGFVGTPLNAMIATSTSLTTHGANKMLFMDNLFKGSWSLADAFSHPTMPKPTPEQILESFKKIPGLTAIVISDKMQIVELKLKTVGDVKLALKHGAYLTSGDTISRMWNKFDNGKISPIIQGISNYIQGPYKAGYLSHLGLGIRNMVDNVKALMMMSRGDMDAMPFIPRAFKAMQDYQKILLAMDGLDDVKRAEYLLGLTDRQLSDYAVIRSASETALNTHLESIMDITVEARRAVEIRKAVMSKNDTILGMIWGNPLTRTALKVQGFGENLGRAAGLFYALEVKGMGGAAAADYVNKFFFDYNKKSKAMNYLSTFVPFAFFPMKNFLLWAEEAEKNPTLFRFFLDMGTQSWNSGTEDRGYAMTAYEQQQQISGNFKVGSTLIKLNPSLFDALSLIPNILQNPTQRLSPMINNVGKLMKGDIEGIELPFKLNYERVSKIITSTIPKVIQGNVEEAPNLVPSLFSTNTASFKSPTTTYSYTTMSRRYGSTRIPRASSYIKKVYLSKGFYNTLYTKAGKSRMSMRLQKPTSRNLAGRIKDNSYMFK